MGHWAGIGPKPQLLISGVVFGLRVLSRPVVLRIKIAAIARVATHLFLFPIFATIRFFSIFFRRWANLVAGLRAVCRPFEVIVVSPIRLAQPQSNSSEESTILTSN